MKSQQEIDLEVLGLNEFVKKYYENPDLTSWDFWKENTLKNVFVEDRRHLFIDSMKYRNQEFDFQKLESFYKSISDLKIEEDIKKYFAYMYFEGFFEYYGIEFSEWLKTKNFTNPKENFELPLSIEESMNYEFGANYLRRQLMNLKYWRIIF